MVKIPINYEDMMEIYDILQKYINTDDIEDLEEISIDVEETVITLRFSR